MEITRGAVVAQMVRDAIVNDDRKRSYLSREVLERAKVWHERAVELHKTGACYFTNLAESMEIFLCVEEPSARVLDFWEGDVVEVETQNEAKTAIVKRISITAFGGYAHVLFTNGEDKSVEWSKIRHSKIPQDILEIAKAQVLATHKCPFSQGDKEDPDGSED